MNHYMDFDPYVIKERNEQMNKEVNSLRLEKRLRKTRNPRVSRLASLIKRGKLLIGGVRRKRLEERGREHFRRTDGSCGRCAGF